MVTAKKKQSNKDRRYFKGLFIAYFLTLPIGLFLGVAGWVGLIGILGVCTNECPNWASISLMIDLFGGTTVGFAIAVYHSIVAIQCFSQWKLLTVRAKRISICAAVSCLFIVAPLACYYILVMVS